MLRENKIAVVQCYIAFGPATLRWRRGGDAKRVLGRKHLGANRLCGVTSYRHPLSFGYALQAFVPVHSLVESTGEKNNGVIQVRRDLQVEKEARCTFTPS